MRRKIWIALGLALVVGVAAHFLLPALAPFPRPRAKRTRCASSLKQIGYGCHLYACDHDEEFPPGLGELYPNYISDGVVFVCPMARNAVSLEHDLGVALREYEPAMFKEKHADYTYVAGLAADGPKDLVIAYDRDGNHDGGRNALFVGSNVEWMKEDDFQTALAKTQEYLKARNDLREATPSPRP